MMQAKVLGALLVAGALFMAGWTVNGWRWQHTLSARKVAAANAAQQQSQQFRAIEQHAQALTDQLAQTQAKAQARSQQTNARIQQEVARYAKTHTDHSAGHCRLDADWVRLHNAAARDLPDTAPTAGQPDVAAASPAAALSTVTHNYALANTCERRLSGWQHWYQQLKETRHDASSPHP